MEGPSLPGGSNPLAFASSGVHRLELGAEVLNTGRGSEPSTSGRSTAPQEPAHVVHAPLGKQAHGRLTWLERHQREQEELRAQGGNVMFPQRAITPDNVGYSLLRKAGWKAGTGLGREEQGRVVPVQAWLQKGNRGIGFDHKAAQEQQQARKADPQAAKKREEAAAARAVGEARKQKIAKIVADELASEDTTTKVKRHLQVMQQEQDDAKRRHIARYLARALDDPFDTPFSTGDSCPLGCKHRLSALNPLLDDDEG